MIQIKVVEDRVFIIQDPGGGSEKRLALDARDALSLLNCREALRDAVALAAENGKAVRRRRIQELELEIQKLRELDRPLPDPDAPAVLAGRPALREGR